jgi:hypothetical protein
MNKHDWKDKALCLNRKTNDFFDNYENDVDFRAEIDAQCAACPVRKQCFAVGISQKEWGVWGGVYMENGKISREYNSHKSKKDWAATWQTLTIET